jgi:group I intron endonuclease
MRGQASGTEDHTTKRLWEQDIEMQTICGIYKIVNRVNGRYYVGSSKDIFGLRWPQHQFELNRRTHHNSHLTHAWHLYGKDNFEIVVVEEVPQDQLYVVEQKYLDVCAANPEQAYNANYAPDGGCPSAESIERIRRKLKGRVFSDEHRRKIGLAMRGRPYSTETRAKIGRASATRTHSPDVRDRIANSLRGQKRSEETKLKMSVSGVGKHNHTAENNPRFDATVRRFVHAGTGEGFTGTRFGLTTKFGLSPSMVGDMIRGKRILVK